MSENEKDLAEYLKISNFASKQISESRDFFEKIYKTTLGAILLIAAVGIGIFYWLVGQKYADIEATVARKTDEQILALKQQIHNRIEDEFKTEKMRAMIQRVAQDQTKSGLSDVITKAVGDQVRVAIKAEGPGIQKIVARETKKFVSENVTIKNFYENIRTEIFSFRETSKILIHIIEKNKMYVYFKLKDVPIAESVQVQFNVFTQPKYAFCVYKNIVVLGWGDSIESIKKEKSHFSIQYSADLTKKDKISKIDLKSDGVYADGKLLTDSSFSNCASDKDEAFK